MRRALSFLCCISLFWCCLSFSACAPEPLAAESIHIVMSAQPGITEPQTNYYKQWLEEKIGFAITLELVDAGYMPEYLRLLFTSGETGVDAIFFAPDDGITADMVQGYGAGGHLLALDSYIAEATTGNMRALLAGYTEYDLQSLLTAEDEHLYYLPNLNTSTALRNAQTLWLNSAWLQQTGMTIPLTTEDFAAVLRAFNTYNANRGNNAGTSIAGSREDAQFIVHYLMNAFTYTDPQNAYLAVHDSEVVFAPITDDWRQGLLYCRDLYDEGLLPDLCFSFSSAQFVRLVNDTRDLAGGFTTSSIGDVLSAGSPALSSRFIHIPPLAGPSGAQYATVQTVLPTPGGVITSACKNPQGVFALMDIMLGEDAYLVAAYGQQGVDWDYAHVGDIGYDGNAAVITVKSHEWNLVQNRNFSQAGPFVTYAGYADGVAWNGYQADQRYLDARAAKVYRAYEPAEYISVLDLQDAQQASFEEIKAYTQQMMVAFITGSEDISDDAAWQRYVLAFDKMGLRALLFAAQASYLNY